jgi:hypothetical protein
MPSSSSLPLRAGTRPRTTPTNPHTQLDQQPTDSRLIEELARRVFTLPGVAEQPSRISVPGARALVLAPGDPGGPAEALLIDREFAHFHPAPDHSLHAMLPTKTVNEAVTAGWAEPHPVALRGLIPANAVMLYAPRDEVELDVIEALVRASYAFARSASLSPPIELDVRANGGDNQPSAPARTVSEPRVSTRMTLAAASARRHPSSTLP